MLYKKIMKEEKKSLSAQIEDNSKTGTDTSEDYLTQKQKINELTIQIETLQRRYNLEKVILDERTKLKQEEITSLRAHISELQANYKLELKKREEEISLLRQKVYELESKLALEQMMTHEKLKLKEDEIKELKLKFEKEEFRLKQEISTLYEQTKSKDESIHKSTEFLSKREAELHSQIEWKQQELLMLKSRFEDELRRLQSDFDNEKLKYEEKLDQKNQELLTIRQEYLKELNNLQIKHTQEQLRAEKLVAQLDETNKDYAKTKLLLESTTKQLEQIMQENKVLKDTIYSPEHIAKIKVLDTLQEMSNLKSKIESLEKAVAQEKLLKEKELKQKEEEIALSKLQLEQYKKELLTQKEKYKHEIEKGSYEKILVLEKEKSDLEMQVKGLNEEIELASMKREKLLQEKESMYNSFVDDLSRGFSHKIRNLLGVISGGVEFCINTVEGVEKKFQPTKNLLSKLLGKKKIYTIITDIFSKLKENLNMVTQHISQMMTSLEKFRDISKPITLTKTNVQINELLKKTISTLKDRAGKQKILIFEEYQQNLPRINVDTQKLEYVFSEIVTNAIEALPKGGNIKVQTMIELSTKMVMIRVFDNGSGIPDTQLGKIFQPFFTNKPDRDGLGLTKVQKIVVAHHGTISVQSEKNKGTNVIVRLPI